MVIRYCIGLILAGLFCFRSAHALETRVVVSQGIGSTIESAAQNAAENALRQVVGAFIDTTQAVEKRAEISNGLRSETKHISSTTSQYSQGSIKNFEVLDSKQENGFWAVDAKVEVRVEDFKAYIKKLALGENEVKLDVLAAMAVDAKQQDTLNDFLVKPLSSLVGGEVVDIKVGDPQRVSDFLDNALRSGDAGYQRSVALIKEQMRVAGWNSNLTLAIPITSSIRRDFLANLAKQLESTATKKRTEESIQSDLAREFVVKVGPLRSRSERLRLFDYFNLPVTNIEPLQGIAPQNQSVRLTLYDEAGVVVSSKKFTLSPSQYVGTSQFWLENKDGVLLSGDTTINPFDQMSQQFHQDLSHVHLMLTRPAGGLIQITADRTGVIFAELSRDQLSQVKRIQFAYVQN